MRKLKGTKNSKNTCNNGSYLKIRNDPGNINELAENKRAKLKRQQKIRK